MLKAEKGAHEATSAKLQTMQLQSHELAAVQSSLKKECEATKLQLEETKGVLESSEGQAAELQSLFGCLAEPDLLVFFCFLVRPR